MRTSAHQKTKPETKTPERYIWVGEGKGCFHRREPPSTRDACHTAKKHKPILNGWIIWDERDTNAATQRERQRERENPPLVSASTHQSVDADNVALLVSVEQTVLLTRFCSRPKQNSIHSICLNFHTRARHKITDIIKLLTS